GVYPGVDLVYYGGESGLEYDFVIAPGADPARVRLAFDGADRVDVDASGDLRIATPLGEVRQRRPSLHRGPDGVRVPAAGGYRALDNGEVGIDVGAHDASRPLVIDPTIVYATTLGSTLNDYTGRIAIDGAGATYLVGSAGTLAFPTTPGRLETAGGGERDAV